MSQHRQKVKEAREINKQRFAQPQEQPNWQLGDFPALPVAQPRGNERKRKPQRPQLTTQSEETETNKKSETTTKTTPRVTPDEPRVQTLCLSPQSPYMTNRASLSPPPPPTIKKATLPSIPEEADTDTETDEHDLTIVSAPSPGLDSPPVTPRGKRAMSEPLTRAELEDTPRRPLTRSLVKL